MTLAQILRALTMTFKMNRVTSLGRATHSGAFSAAAAIMKRLTWPKGTRLEGRDHRRVNFIKINKY